MVCPSPEEHIGAVAYAGERRAARTDALRRWGVASLSGSCRRRSRVRGLDYDALIDAMTCHGKDRHVLAAAVAGGPRSW